MEKQQSQDIIVIAIDGPASSGKGTLARKIAEKYGFDWLDTGKLYRAVAWKLIESGKTESSDLAAELAKALTPKDLRQSELHLPEVATLASKISAVEEVRQALLEFQRNFASKPPSGKGAVLDGRDIGTVIAPDAQVKIFLNASAETRAKRRHQEAIDRNQKSDYNKTLKELIERDARDQNREHAPLKLAPDALEVDTTGLSIEKVCQVVNIFIDKALKDLV